MSMVDSGTRDDNQQSTVHVQQSKMFGQTFETNDIAVIGLLVVLEGFLSIDNALVLGILAKRLPRSLQSKALSYGLIGAVIFRLIAVVTAAALLRFTIVKLLGGLYLIYIAVKHFFLDKKHSPEEKLAGMPVGRKASFWQTVFVIELTDIAFAVDSIVAAIGIVGAAPPGAQRHPKLWVIFTGGMLGVVLMRFAAVIFIRLLEKFPRFETAAYLLIIVIGAKLVADWAFNDEQHPHRLDFHHTDNIAFWIFWGLMAISFAVGFIPAKGTAKKYEITEP
jgi:YkoY family integral membrane protein